ncbi:hypothetical protein SELMODRAFT_420918 [Selaginella moellendorffii]|uniref:Uncharacterized protein n=1 Tax=Selaginella moellendorffii TaxID=88036 RepID=D8SDJ2_SELML|nr:hypothetical protein SELMODRAFT_420918 [Selaginella moellendorffii]
MPQRRISPSTCQIILRTSIRVVAMVWWTNLVPPSDTCYKGARDMDAPTHGELRQAAARTLVSALRAAKLYGRIACSLKAGGWIVLRDGWGPIYISTKLELFDEGVEDLDELEETDGEPLLLLPGPES